MPFPKNEKVLKRGQCVSFIVEEDDAKRIRRMAERQGLTLSALVRLVVREFLMAEDEGSGTEDAFPILASNGEVTA